MKKRKIWSHQETELLKEKFANEFNSNLSILLNRTEKSIAQKANSLGLIKSKTHKSICISKRNKMVGRDLTPDFIKKESLKYRTKSEMSKKDPSLYSSINRLGMGDEVFSHMVKTSFSIPQLILLKLVKKFITKNIFYNTRSIIKPYELDIYLPDYKIAFEYDGKGWHVNNDNDKIKDNLCVKNDILLFRLKENNRDYENDVKNQFINLIPKLTKIIKKQISEKDVIDVVLMDDVYEEIYKPEELITIAKKYNSFSEFIKNEKKTYKKLTKLKLLDLATDHMTDRRKKRTIDEVKNKIDQFNFLIDLIKKDFGTYQFVKKNKLDYLLENLKRIK